jgi:ABC-type sugar transport system substrate-binding protein
MKKLFSIASCILIVCLLVIPACTSRGPVSSAAPESPAPAASVSAPLASFPSPGATFATETADNGGTEVKPVAQEIPDLKGKKIGAIVLLEDQFQRMLQITMKKTAEKYGAEVQEGLSGGELDREVELVNAYAAAGVNGICIFPVSLTGSVAALQNAANNGIQIYCANMNMNADWQAGYAEMDQYAIGVSVGRFCREYIKRRWPNSKPRTAIMQFKALLPEMSTQRTEGFLSQTQDLIEKVQDVDAWDADKSVNIAAEVMNAHQDDLDLIFCANEGGTVGTVMAVKNAGKQIPVFGIDASEQLSNMLLSPDNILQAVCGQDPIALGRTSMTNLCLRMMGKPYRTGVKLPGVPLTREKPDEIKAYIDNLKTFLDEK